MGTYPCPDSLGYSFRRWKFLVAPLTGKRVKRYRTDWIQWCCQVWARRLSPQMSLSPHRETYWSRITRWLGPTADPLGYRLPSEKSHYGCCKTSVDDSNSDFRAWTFWSSGRRRGVVCMDGCRLMDEAKSSVVYGNARIANYLWSLKVLHVSCKHLCCRVIPPLATTGMCN